MAASLEDIQVSGMYVTSRVICRRRSAACLMVVLHNNLVSLHLQQLKSCSLPPTYKGKYNAHTNSSYTPLISSVTGVSGGLWPGCHGYLLAGGLPGIRVHADT